MEYRTIPTTLGRAKLEQAALLQVPLELTLVEFGDGNGAEYLPTGLETALKRKVYEAVPNMLADSAESETWVELHAVLPFDAGGWWLREYIVRDAAGDAIFIGNLPESFKPVGSSGAIKDIAFELVFDILSPDSVTLKVDPSKVLATRKYVDESIALAVIEATQAEAEAGTDGTRKMTPRRVWQAITKRLSSQSQAEGGTDNETMMSPLRVFQAMTKYGLGSTAAPPLTTVGDTTTPSGLYRVDGTATGLPIAEPGFVDIRRGGAGLVSQRYYSRNSQRAFFRRANGALGSWAEYMHTGTAATLAEAESGTAEGKWMSPLRVFQAIAKTVVQATEKVLGVAKVATQAQTNAGTDDATIVTPKKLRLGIVYSFGTNGYFFLPTWLLGFGIQWGEVPDTVADSVQTVAFPVAFTSTCFGMLANLKSAVARPYNTAVYSTPTSLSGGKVVRDVHASPYAVGPIFWFAIGI